MKRPRLLAVTMTIAATFLMTGCGVDLADHPKQLAAAEDQIHDAVVAAGAPGVTDAGVSVFVDNIVLVGFWVTIDQADFNKITLCRSIGALTETIPFDTTRILAVSLLLPGETHPTLDARPYLTSLGVTEFLNELGQPSSDLDDGSYISWEDAQAIAASCS